MEEAKIPNTDKTHYPNELEDTGNKAKYSDILTKEDTFSTNQLSSEMTPKFKEICKERKDLGSHKKEDECLHERAIQGTSKKRISQDHDIASENQGSSEAFRLKFKPVRKGKKGNRKKCLEVDKVKSLQSEKNTDENVKDTNQEDSDISSEKKVNNFKSLVSKYLRRALRRPIRTMRNIIFSRNKGKKPKTIKSQSDEMLAQTKYSSQMDKSQQISNEEGVSEVKLETLGNSKTEIVNTGKKKGKSDALPKLEMHPETSTKSKDETLSLPSTSSTCASEIQNDTETKSLSSKVKSTEEVLGHFRRFMQSSTKSVDTFKSEDNIQEDKKIFSESRIRPLDELKETATESASQDLEHSEESASNLAIQNLKDITKEKPNLIMTENSRNVTNSEVSATQIDNSKSLIKTIKDIPRQRTVYDERYEYVRGWVAEQIKDKGQCLKLKIKEGEYSDDIETKMRCIEEAEDIQDETDAFLDELDEYDRMDNYTKGFQYSTQDYYSISPAPRKKDLRWPEGQLRSLLDLFNYLYKFSNSESNLKNLYKRIYQRMLKMDYDIYLGTKEEKDTASKVIEKKGRNAVDEFYLELIECHSNVKKEIPHTEIRSPDDYRNYVRNLIIAAKENLTCLHNVLAELSPMIRPLHMYISQAHKKFLRTYSFLKEERSDIFLEGRDEDIIYV